MPGPYETMESAVWSRVASEVETGLSVPVAYPNEREEAAVPRVEIALEHGQAESLVGGQLYRKRARLRARVLTDTRVGTKAAFTLVDGVRGTFLGQIADDIHYGIPSVSAQGIVARSSWQAVVEVDLYHDDEQAPDAHVGTYEYASLLGARKTVRTRFAREVATPLSLPVRYDNDGRDNPSYDPSQPGASQLWALLTVVSGESEWVGHGRGSRVDNTGLAIATIFAPLGIGTEPTVQLIDAIVPRFRNVREDGVLFGVPTVRTVGRRGPWWQANALLPFSSEGVTP